MSKLSLIVVQITVGVKRAKKYLVLEGNHRFFAMMCYEYHKERPGQSILSDGCLFAQVYRPNVPFPIINFILQKMNDINAVNASTDTVYAKVCSFYF